MLTGFSNPVTRLWDYRRGDIEPIVLGTPGARPYQYFDADREVAFLHEMLRRAVREEIPAELGWLKGYDAAFAQLNAELNLPRKDLSALIRTVRSNGGKLSRNRRKQYAHLPDEVLDRVEQVVGEAFGGGSGE